MCASKYAKGKGVGCCVMVPMVTEKNELNSRNVEVEGQI